MSTPVPALPSPPARVPARIDPEGDYSRLTAAELRAQLDARQRDLQYHVAAIKHEITEPSTYTIGGRPVEDVVRADLPRFAALAAGAGLVLSVLAVAFARRRKRRNLPDPGDAAEMIRQYVEAVIDSAAHRVSAGASTDDALRAALRGRGPIVYLSASNTASEQAESSFKQAIDVAIKSALGFALKAGADQLTQRLTGHTDVIDGVAAADAAADAYA